VTATPRVFRTATWYRVLSVFAALAICGAGSYYVRNGTALWQTIGGAALIAFGLGGFFDVLVSRIVLDTDAIHVISLVRRRSYPRADFESAKVDGGVVCLKRRDGGWLPLPNTGAKPLSERNTIDSWIKAHDR
jgi:hypothetical protein